MAHQSPETQRVLRVGIVCDGKVIRESLIPPGVTPSIGTSPRCTLTLPAMPGIPEQVTLFHCRRGRYTLCLPPSAALKLSRAGQVQNLSLGGARLPLEDSDRGRITLGELTILFQLVEPPPMPARLLKSSFRPRLLDEDDPTFLGILSLCSAAAAAMMIYVSTLPLSPLVEVQDLPDYFATVQLTAPPVPVEPAPVLAQDGPPTPVAAEPAPEPEAVAETPRPRPEDAPGLSVEERERQRALALQRRQTEVTEQSALLQGLDSLIRSRGASGSNIFQGQDAFSEEFSDAVRNITPGGSMASASPGAMVRGATAGGARGDERLGGIEGGTGGGQATVAVAPAPTVPRSPTAKPEGVKVSGPSAQKEAIKRGVRGAQVRSCYEQRLKELPDLSGRLVVEFSIFDNVVEEVRFSENTTRDRELETCVARAVKAWRFVDVAEAEVSLPYALSSGG